MTITPIDMTVLEANAEALGIPRQSLMESAGKCLAYKIIHLTRPCRVSIYAGVGGNGGDGFVAARYLINKGFEVAVYLLGDENHIRSTEAKINWEILRKFENYSPLLNLNLIKDSANLQQSRSEFIIDALLGTGTKGKLREPFSSAVDLINNSQGTKIAVDISSGLDPLTGKVFDKAVTADYTVTFHEEKSGLTDAKYEYVGEVYVCDIGIPPEAELFTGPGDLLRVKDRELNSHKGENGRVLVVGGSKDYSGAPTLAALSALRSGVDIVDITCPTSVSTVIHSYSPDLIVKGLEGEYFKENHVAEILEHSATADVVVIGCGVGREKETSYALNELIKKLNKPLVIDADALKVLDLDLIKKYGEEVVLTPHAHEFSLLFNQELPENISNKIEVVKKAAKMSNSSVVLKGPVDIICEKEQIKLNSTGNPGMTVGGTGDCLAGLIGGLIAQGHTKFEASFLGAYFNGLAGELAADKFGYHFLATDMIDLIPLAFKRR